MKSTCFSFFKVAVITTLLVFLISCRKTFTCSCNADDPVHNIEHSLVMAEGAAEQWCKDWNNDVFLDEEEDEKKEGWKCVLKPSN